MSEVLAGAFAGASNPADPTAASIIDVLALERLMPALRAACHYVLTVSAQRHTWLLGIHRFRDEAFLALVALLEAHSLFRNGSSFAEHFYGLERRASRSSTGPRSSLLPWLVLVLLPYVRAKLDETFELTRTSDGAARDGMGEDGGASGDRPAPVRAAERSTRDALLRLLQSVSRVACAALDAANLGQLLLFMSERSRHVSLAQRVLNYTLHRPGPQRGAPAGLRAATPSSRAAVVRSASWLETMGHVLELPLRHARNLLLLSVFGYRLVEWWYLPDNAPPRSLKLIPPPPFPPPLHEAAAALPPPGLCGVCRMEPREPTATPSGFVLCGSCAREAVRRQGVCPISGMPMLERDLRRLYETSRAPTKGYA
jgi:peroxin-12